MKKILVTGGGSGLGKEIVKNLANKNLKVYFTYCNSQDSAKDLEKSYNNVTKIHCDFKDKNSISCLVKTMELEQINVLINNALPFFSQKHFHKFSIEQITEGFQYNVATVVTLLLNSVKYFRKNKKGKIINILSSSTVGPPPLGYSIYTAEKKYIESISNSIAVENSKFNIQINSISPSFMNTDLNDYLDSRITDEMIKTAPLKKFLTPLEVSNLVYFLIQNDCVYLNGQNINLNAGK